MSYSTIPRDIDVATLTFLDFHTKHHFATAKQVLGLECSSSVQWRKDEHVGRASLWRVFNAFADCSVLEKSQGKAGKVTNHSRLTIVSGSRRDAGHVASKVHRSPRRGGKKSDGPSGFSNSAN